MNVKEFFLKYGRLLTIITLVVIGVYIIVRLYNEFIHKTNTFDPFLGLIALSITILTICLLLFFKKINIILLSVAALLAKATMYYTLPVSMLLSIAPRYGEKLPEFLSVLVFIGIFLIFASIGEIPIIWLILKLSNNKPGFAKVARCSLLANTIFAIICLFGYAIIPN